MTDGQERTALAKWLIAAMRAHDLGVRQLALYSKVSRSAISSILTGETKEPDSSTIDKMAAYFGVSPNELLDLRSVGKYTQKIPTSTLLAKATGVLLIPLVEQTASAGKGVELLDYEYFQPTITGSRNLFAIKTHGRCMTPLIDDGDTVVVDRDAKWEDGRVVLARVDDSIVVKRFFEHNGLIRLHPDNPEYHDVFVPEVDILGVCIRVIKPL